MTTFSRLLPKATDQKLNSKYLGLQGRMLKLFLLFLLSVVNAAPRGPKTGHHLHEARVIGEANAKQVTYNVVTQWASAGSHVLSCEDFAKYFAMDALVFFPVGTKGMTAAEFCEQTRGRFAGMGAYPRDLWIGSTNSTTDVAFSFHVRAVSHQGCFVDWPSIVVLTIHSVNGLILRWSQYYDDGWMDAAIFCKNHSAKVKELITKSEMEPAVFNPKDAFYNSVVTWTTGTCEDWVKGFAVSGRVVSPVGTAASVGHENILKFCNHFKEVYISFGAYPRDLFIADDASSLATSFHIRALSNEKCHVEWPSVLVVHFNTEGLISNWLHYYDSGWNDAQLKCR